jgi:hypothetical protein
MKVYDYQSPTPKRQTGLALAWSIRGQWPFIAVSAGARRAGPRVPGARF